MLTQHVGVTFMTPVVVGSINLFLIGSGIEPLQMQKQIQRKFTEPYVILNGVKNLCRFFVASLLRMTGLNVVG